MNIGFIAHNSKKSLMEDFCIAYKGILSRHEIYATGTTGRRIEEVTGLRVYKFLAGSVGANPVIVRNVMGNLKEAGLISISQALCQDIEFAVHCFFINTKVYRNWFKI